MQVIIYLLSVYLCGRMHVRAVYAETEHYKLVDGQSLKNNISTRSVSWLLTGLGLMVNRQNSQATFFCQKLAEGKKTFCEACNIYVYNCKAKDMAWRV